MTARPKAARFDRCRGRSPRLSILFARKCAIVASTRGLHAALTEGYEAAATIARGYRYAALSPGRYGHKHRNAQVEADGRRDIAKIAKLGTAGAWVRQPLRICGCRGGIGE